MRGAVAYRTKLPVTLPETTRWVGGEGGVSSGHKCKIQLNVPPFFFAELRCKRGGI